MKMADVHTGATYLVKVAGNLVPVKIDREHLNGGWEGTSVKTGKTIRIKSPQRLHKRLDGDGPTGKRIVTKAEYEAEATQDPNPTEKRDTGEPAATPTKPMSLLDAAAHLLSMGTGDPMRCKDIVDLAIDRGLWKPGSGRTPANTLYAAILREIKVKGEASRFLKIDRGKFALAEKV